MKRVFVLLLLLVSLIACQKKTLTGDLLITVKYDGINEEHVDCWLYETYDKFERYEFLYQLLSDEYGEIFFPALEPGWYYLEAEKLKSSMFTIYKFDSVEVVSGRQTNKLLIMSPVK